jgi:hypothetical protein
MTSAAAIYETIRRQYPSSGFLANVILCHHSKPTTKLKGLLRLLGDGHVVTTGQFDMDVLWVDGATQPWAVLSEKAGER